MNIETIIRKIKKNNPGVDIKKIRSAYAFAKEKHKGQKRKSGESYIVHPLFVSDFLSQPQDYFS
jgi:GTP pyrophosphokinase